MVLSATPKKNLDGIFQHVLFQFKLLWRLVLPQIFFLCAYVHTSIINLWFVLYPITEYNFFWKSFDTLLHTFYPPENVPLLSCCKYFTSSNKCLVDCLIHKYLNLNIYFLTNSRAPLRAP